MVSRLAAVCVFAASAAWAQEIYSWTDADGTTHFTDNPAAVPRGKSARPVAGTGVSVVPAEKQEAPPAAASAPPSAPAKVQPQVPKADPREAERGWRTRFQEACARIERLEQAVAEDAKVVEEVSGLPITGQVRCSYDAVPLPSTLMQARGTAPANFGCISGADPRWEEARARLAQNRAELAQARAALEELERRASSQSVPREWRR
ncbi:MAG: DUF4124 domain-containing protein [Deltaproteobacteria bacterium]|nr:DUF4124 domain-containing protein [Deltaproteobacteria bacterium]